MCKRDYCMITAYAEMYNVTRRIIQTIGTAQLCLCRSDEARRLLIFGLNPARRPGPYMLRDRRRTKNVTVVP